MKWECGDNEIQLTRRFKRIILHWGPLTFWWSRTAKSDSTDPAAMSEPARFTCGGCGRPVDTETGPDVWWPAAGGGAYRKVPLVHECGYVMIKLELT